MQANQAEELEIVRLMRALGPEWQSAGQPKRPARPPAMPPVAVAPPPVTNQSLEKIHQFFTASHALVKVIRLPRSIRNLFNCENSPPATPLPGTKKHWQFATAFSTAAASVLVAWAALNGPGTPAPEPEETATASASNRLVRGTGTVNPPPTKLAYRLTQRLPLSTARASIAPGQGLKPRATNREAKAAFKDPTIDKLIDYWSTNQGVNPLAVKHTLLRESSYGVKKLSKVLTDSSDTTAVGIAQLTEQPFMAILSRHGHSLGLSEYANAIYTVKDKQGKIWYTAGKREDEILKLREKPEVALPVGIKLMKEDALMIQAASGRTPTIAEVDMAYFTGGPVGTDIVSAYINKEYKTPAYTLANPGNYNSSPTNMKRFFHGGVRKNPYSVAEFYGYCESRSNPEICRAPALIKN